MILVAMLMMVATMMRMMAMVSRRLVIPAIVY